MSNYIIPENLQVGYQNRQDSLDGKLGFVTYKTPSGIIARETSFNKWIDKNIPVDFMSNNPKSGFTMGEGIHRYGHYGSNDKFLIRLYSPEGFEFEITMENFLEIAYYATIDKRYIKGDFVFAWKGNQIHLLSIHSPDYQEAKAYSDKLYKPEKISADSIKVGDVFEIKKHKKKSLIGLNIMYLGEFDIIPHENFSFAKIKDLKMVNGEYEWTPKTKKEHVFMSIYLSNGNLSLMTYNGYFNMSEINNEDLSKLYNCGDNPEIKNPWDWKMHDGYLEVVRYANALANGTVLKEFKQANFKYLKNHLLNALNKKSELVTYYMHKSRTKIFVISAEKRGYSYIQVNVKEVTLDEIKTGKFEGKMSTFNLLDMPDLEIINNNFSNGQFQIKK